MRDERGIWCDTEPHMRLPVLIRRTVPCSTATHGHHASPRVASFQRQPVGVKTRTRPTVGTTVVAVQPHVRSSFKGYPCLPSQRQRRSLLSRPPYEFRLFCFCSDLSRFFSCSALIIRRSSGFGRVCFLYPFCRDETFKPGFNLGISRQKVWTTSNSHALKSIYLLAVTN